MTASPRTHVFPPALRAECVIQHGAVVERTCWRVDEQHNPVSVGPEQLPASMLAVLEEYVVAKMATLPSSSVKFWCHVQWLEAEAWAMEYAR